MLVLSVKNVNFRIVSFTYVNLKQEEEMGAEPVSHNIFSNLIYHFTFKIDCFMKTKRKIHFKY